MLKFRFANALPLCAYIPEAVQASEAMVQTSRVEMDISASGTVQIVHSVV